MGDILYVVLPAYNEEDNIGYVVKEWMNVLTDKDAKSRLVIADSGSTDKTHSILLQLKEENNQIEILGKTEKEHGPKLCALYDYAIKCGADYVFQTDSDGQTNPAEFDDFWRLRGKYDAIFGYRPIRGDGKIRKFVEKMVCLLVKVFFGIEVPDANAPFRLMRTEILKSHLKKIPKNFNLPNVMLTVYFCYFGDKYKFLKITFRDRRSGKNSINIKKIVIIGMNAIRDFAYLKKHINDRYD